MVFNWSQLWPILYLWPRIVQKMQLRNIWRPSIVMKFSKNRISVTSKSLNQFSPPNSKPPDAKRTTVVRQRRFSSGKIIIFILTLRRPLRHSFSKTVKKYTSQIEYSGFFEILFLIECFWNPQNAFENFRQRFYLLWCLLIFGFWLFFLNRVVFYDLKTYFETFKVVLRYKKFLFTHHKKKITQQKGKWKN